MLRTALWVLLLEAGLIDERTHGSIPTVTPGDPHAEPKKVRLLRAHTSRGCLYLVHLLSVDRVTGVLNGFTRSASCLRCSSLT